MVTFEKITFAEVTPERAAELRKQYEGNPDYTISEDTVSAARYVLQITKADTGEPVESVQYSTYPSAPNN